MSKKAVVQNIDKEGDLNSGWLSRSKRCDRDRARGERYKLKGKNSESSR